MSSNDALRPLATARKVGLDLAVNDIANPEWDNAESVRINQYWSGELAPRIRHAEARIMWSKKALHIRFVCNQGEPLVKSEQPQTDKKTMGLWDRDVCEIFIAPDPHFVERYMEFEAAPTGEWLDVSVRWSPEKRESDWNFISHMTTATRIDKDRITIAMRIPWSHWIHEPQQGEHWRVNLFRCVGKDPNRGYLAWQPTRTPQPAFHLPQVFGWLLFE